MEILENRLYSDGPPPTNPRLTMRKGRLTIARLLGVILFFGVILAGLRSGSNDWFKSIYTLTFILLVYAGIAARYRGAFWYGFAVAGWAYFVVGFGPWINSPAGSPPPGTVNRNLISSVILEVVTGSMPSSDSAVTYTAGGPTGIVWFQKQSDNRNGIGHCALTILFGFVVGLVTRRHAKEE